MIIIDYKYFHRKNAFCEGGRLTQDKKIEGFKALKVDPFFWLGKEMPTMGHFKTNQPKDK